MLRYLVNFLYPPRCSGCNRRIPADSTRRVCHRCVASIEPLHEPLCAVCGIPAGADSPDDEWCRACAASPPHFTRARAITSYRAVDENGEMRPLPAMIRRHKYGPDQSLSRSIAEYLDGRIPFAGKDYDLIIPVPLHSARLRWRGFNQAALLADAVARRLACPTNFSTLARVVATIPQTSQSHGERRLNVRSAFAVRRPQAVANRRVLLVDDVMTTGATVDECSRILLRAGARRVDVFTLARAL
jgi:ComF family protein